MQLTRETDVKLDVKDENRLQEHSFRASLVHSRTTSTQASGPGQSFEMSGALRSIDDYLDGVPSSVWPAETETGNGFQASGIDDGRPISEILKRPKWPPNRVAGRETDRTFLLREGESLRREL